MSAPAPDLPVDHVARPGRRPLAVEVAFWLTAAHAVVGSLSWVAVGVALDLHESTIGLDRALFVALCLVGTIGHVGWMVLGWRVRDGHPTAREIFCGLTGFALASSVWLCFIGWWTALPGAGLLGAILALLSLPSSHVWFRR